MGFPQSRRYDPNRKEITEKDLFKFYLDKTRAEMPRDSEGMLKLVQRMRMVGMLTKEEAAAIEADPEAAVKRLSP